MVFARMISNSDLPIEEIWKGSSEDQPIKLENVEFSELESFLSLLYPYAPFYPTIYATHFTYSII